MAFLLQDIRFGIRVLLRNRSFTVTAILALALGIGATSAIFSVIYGVLLKPLPYRDPQRLVRVYQYNPMERFHDFPLSPADFLDYRKRNRVFAGIAASVRQDQQYGGDPAERLVGMRVSHEYFRVFGVDPLLGRTFTAEEETTTSGSSVVIISQDVWQRLLGGDPRILGKTIRLTDSMFRIVGVMPAGFEDLSSGYRVPAGERVQVWLPFDMLGNPRGVPRAFHYCNTVARLKPGASIQQAQADMNAIAAGLETQYADDKDWRVQLKPLEESLVGAARPMLLILAGAVGFVLLIACVNVANLLLARATAREREMAVRIALGAGSGRLLRQMLTESATLAMLGGALGLLLGWWGVPALVSIAPQQVPRLRQIGLDAHVALPALAISLLSGLLFGLAPAFTASTGNLHRSRPRGVLVVAEISLTFVLLIGAGLLLRSFFALSRVDPGFSPHGVLTMNTTLSYPKLVGARRYAAFYESFLEKLAGLPGVTAVGAASKLPWAGGSDNALIGIEGRPRPAGMAMHAHYESVSPDYLRTMGVPLLAGRWLETSDHFDAPRVVLINKTLALQYWPTLQASLGRRIYTMRDAATVESPMTIVGVVGDVKDGPTLPAQATFYWPFLQSPSFGNYVVLRATNGSATLIPAVRQLARQMGNDLTIQEIRPMEQVIAGAVATQRFALQLLGLFALAALLLALIGTYGVMSFATGRRAKEIAIRSALGATPVHTLALLLRQGMAWILSGLIAGGFAAANLSRLLKSILYQVSATDPWTFAAAGAFLAIAAVAAGVIPAWKIVRIDAMQVLRHE